MKLRYKPQPYSQMKLVKVCSICSKPLTLKSKLKLSATQELVTYECGHIFAEQIEEASTLANGLVLDSVDKSKHARPYQADGVRFIRESGYNCVIGDQMRLGKTPQALLALASDYKNRTPCLILVRSANLWQWIREYKVWCDSLPLGIYPIEGGAAFIPHGFSAYIISMDTLGVPGTCKNCKHSLTRHADEVGACTSKNCKCGLAEPNDDSMVERLLAFGFKLVIADEAHSFKNTESRRSRALIRFLHEIAKEEIEQTWQFSCALCAEKWEVKSLVVTTQETVTTSKTAYCPKCNAFNKIVAQREKVLKARKCGVIMLTGTPIKNRADEYFVPLNIVAPTLFNNKQRFEREWLSDDKRKIKSYRLDDFRKTIAPYVLRREKEDVFEDLPPLNRSFTMIEVENEHLKKLYNATLDQIEAEQGDMDFRFFDSIGKLAILRHITGLAKVDWTVDTIRDMIDSTDKDKKYAIGIHHKSVKTQLAYKLKEFGVVTLSGEDSAAQKDWIMTSFEKSHDKCLVLNMLAGGVGMDFHYVDYALILERMWSAADEEQFEFRFYNPDTAIMGAGRSTNVEYVVAKGTIDEFFYDLVEQKRKIFGETIATNWDMTKDTDSFQSLMRRTLQGRLK